VRAEVESARRDWEDAYRRFQDESRDPASGDALHLQLDAVREELRKRLGGAYTLGELADEYRHAERWVRETVATKAPSADWPRNLAIVEGTAFHLYSRGAVDYDS
jgi:hypothetical protein